MAVATAPSAPAEKPTSRSSAIRSAHAQSVVRVSTHSAIAAPTTPTICVAIVATIVRRVPSTYSAKPTSSAKPPATGRYCTGSSANSAPVTTVHHCPSWKAGRPYAT